MTIISNKKIEVIKILFKYHDYVNVFDKINRNKLFEHRSHDYAIETKNKIVYFEFSYNLFITKFEIFKKYLNDNLKKFLSYFLRRLQTHLLCSSRKKKRSFTIIRKL